MESPKWRNYLKICFFSIREWRFSDKKVFVFIEAWKNVKIGIHSAWIYCLNVLSMCSYMYIKFEVTQNIKKYDDSRPRPHRFWGLTLFFIFYLKNKCLENNNINNNNQNKICQKNKFLTFFIDSNLSHLIWVCS